MCEQEITDLKKEIIELGMVASRLKHRHKMDELRYMRETERLKHEWDLERERIRSAEIKKNTILKSQLNEYKGGKKSG